MLKAYPSRKKRTHDTSIKPVTRNVKAKTDELQVQVPITRGKTTPQVASTCGTIQDTSKLRRKHTPKRDAPRISYTPPVRERSPSSEASDASELSTTSSTMSQPSPASPMHMICCERLTRSQMKELKGIMDKKEEQKQQKQQEEHQEEEEQEEQQEQQQEEQEEQQQDEKEETIIETKEETEDGEVTSTETGEPSPKRIKSDTPIFIPAERVVSNFFQRISSHPIPKSHFEYSIPIPLIAHRTYWHLKYMHVPEEFTEFTLPDECKEEKAYQVVMGKQPQVPKFKQIDQNKYSRAALSIFPRRRRNEDEDLQRCVCRRLPTDTTPLPNVSYNCGDMCLNRLLCVECDDECCELGDACENRRFTQKKTAKVEPFKTELKGWGLRACENIPSGTLVVEYIGELIDNAECARRMKQELQRTKNANAKRLKAARDARREGLKKQRELKEKEAKEATKFGWKKSRSPTKINVAAPKKGRARATVDTSDEEPDDIDEVHGGANYYFLTLIDDVIIDAGRRGGIARFTNHSCDPNCVVQKWNVGNGLRVGFFARRMIPAGTEITIDYQYDRIGSLKRQACYCGAANCAKFIGGKKRMDDGDEEDEDEDDMDENQRLAVIRKRALTQGKHLPPSMADRVCAECARDEGPLLMCDGKIGHEHCTRVYHLSCLGMKEKPRGRWLCPYHVCRDCTSGRPPKVYCRTCADAWCEECVAPQLERGDVKILPLFPKTDKITWAACVQCQKDPICERPEEAHMYHGYEERSRLAAEAEAARLQRERTWLQTACDDMIRDGECDLYRLMTHLEAQRAWEEQQDQDDGDEKPFHERYEMDEDEEMNALNVDDSKFTVKVAYHPIAPLYHPPNRRLQNQLMRRVDEMRDAYEEEQDRLAEEEEARIEAAKKEEMKKTKGMKRQRQRKSTENLVATRKSQRTPRKKVQDDE